MLRKLGVEPLEITYREKSCCLESLYLKFRKVPAAYSSSYWQAE